MRRVRYKGAVLSESESQDDSSTDMPPSPPTEQHRVMPRKRPIVISDSDEDYLHRQPLKMTKTKLQDNRDHREATELHGRVVQNSQGWTTNHHPGF